MRPLAEIIDELDQAASIPEFLESKGIKGVQGDCGACPVAEYVQREAGADLVSVLSDYVKVVFTGDVPAIIMADNTERIAEFIEEFDAGFYPQLDVNAEVSGE